MQAVGRLRYLSLGRPVQLPGIVTTRGSRRLPAAEPQLHVFTTTRDRRFVKGTGCAMKVLTNASLSVKSMTQEGLRRESEGSRTHGSQEDVKGHL